MRKDTKNKGIRAAFKQCLEKHPGQPVWIDDIIDQTGFARTQILSCASNLITQDPDYPIKVHERAAAWVYRPNGESKPGKRVFEELAVTKNGEIIIQDEEGNPYLARGM